MQRKRDNFFVLAGEVLAGEGCCTWCAQGKSPLILLATAAGIHDDLFSPSWRKRSAAKGVSVAPPRRGCANHSCGEDHGVEHRCTKSQAPDAGRCFRIDGTVPQH